VTSCGPNDWVLRSLQTGLTLALSTPGEVPPFKSPALPIHTSWAHQCRIARKCCLSERLPSCTCWRPWPAAKKLKMAPRSRFTRLDAFSKTVEDARIRTTSGGIVTIVSVIIIFWLVWGEWSEYRTIVLHPELIVDKGRGKSKAC
jgi:hypothetical protein